MPTVTQTLPDGRVLRMCWACAVNEHESCEVTDCDDCAICNTVGRGKWVCGRCGNRYQTETAVTLHAQVCTNPTIRVLPPN